MAMFHKIKRRILTLAVIGSLCVVPQIYCKAKSIDDVSLGQSLNNDIVQNKIDKYNIKYDGDFLIDKNGVLWYYKGDREDVVIPDKVKIIERSVFLNHDEIKSIQLPKNLSLINNYAFSGCARIKEIKIPDTVESIGSFAFSNCSRLERIFIGSSVKHLGPMSFWACNDLKNIDVSEENSVFASYKGVLYDKSYDVLIKCPQGFEGKFIALKKIKKVCEYAFSGCSKLEKIVFNHNIEYIGESAFFNCCSLIKVELGDSLRYIGPCAFAECMLLDNVDIPETIQHIGGSAFYECKSLRNVTIRAKDFKIEYHVFRCCNKDLTFYGHKGSFLETYTMKRNFKFKTISE